MQARQIIGQTTYGPETLKVLFTAFDKAWAVIEPSITGRPEAIEAARLKLANLILTLADDDAKDPERLKCKALLIMGTMTER